MFQFRSTHLNVLLLVVLAILVGSQVVDGQEGGDDGAGERRQAITAAVGTAFTYQGYLEDDNGPIDGVSCDFRFNLYDAANGTSAIAGPINRTTTPSQGVFTVELDFGDQFDGSDRYLGIAARCPGGSGAYTELTPYQRLTAAPYAMSLRPGATISGNGAAKEGALNVESSAIGLRVSSTNDDGIVVKSSGDDGMFINSTSGDGIHILSAGTPPFTVPLGDPSPNNNGVEIEQAHGNGVQVLWAEQDGVRVDVAEGNGVSAITTSNSKYGGYFENDSSTTGSGVGLYARGNQGGATPDIILGANDTGDVGDDGVISSEPSIPGSDIFLRSNDAIVATLNADGNTEDSDFEVQVDGDMEFGVDDSGAIFSDGNYYKEISPGSNTYFRIIPIAFGSYNKETHLANTTPNVVGVNWVASSQQFEISIENESYDNIEYMTLVTVADDDGLAGPLLFFATTNANSGKLIVHIWDHLFNRVEWDFHFVVYKMWSVKLDR